MNENVPTAPDPTLFDPGWDAPTAIIGITGIDRLPRAEAESLLGLLARGTFLVSEVGVSIASRRKTQVVLSAERARGLSRFARLGCVTSRLPEPSLETLAAMARLAYGPESESTINNVAEQLSRDLPLSSGAPAVDPAAFADLVASVIQLRVEPGGPTWRGLLDGFGIG